MKNRAIPWNNNLKKEGETMDVSGEVADLMVKESMQITEETIKMLAAGSKNLAAFLLALSQDNKKLSGQTNMARLLRDGKELKVFHIKESDLDDFRKFGKKNVLYAVIKDSRATDGMVDLITNVDYVSQVNYFMKSRGYDAPEQSKAEKTPNPVFRAFHPAISLRDPGRWNGCRRVLPAEERDRAGDGKLGLHCCRGPYRRDGLFPVQRPDL